MFETAQELLRSILGEAASFRLEQWEAIEATPVEVDPAGPSSQHYQ